MTHTVIPSSADFLVQLVNPAVRALLLAGGAGVALGACRVKATAARLFAWKTVLYAALAMPLLGWMLPAIKLPVPTILRSATRHFASSQRTTQSDHSEFRDMPPAAANTSRTTASSGTAATATLRTHQAEPAMGTISARPYAPTPINWAAIATALYLGVAALLLVRISLGLMFGRRLRRTAKEIREPQLMVPLVRCARSFKLVSIPIFAESEVISVPLTMGVLHPTILFPANWRDWDDAKRDAVLTHEISHVARRDALTQHLALLHRAVFWFSPLAWWLERHLSELAEQASDEVALSCGADLNNYAKALLGFFEALHAAPGRVWWQGVAMAKIGPAERRLERILAWNKEGAIPMGIRKSVAAAIVLFAVPTIFLAASARPFQDQLAQQTPAPAPPKPSAALHPLPAGPAEPAPPPRQRVSVAPLGVVISKDGFTSVPPLAPMSPIGPMSPLAPPAAWSGQSGRSGYSYAYGYDDEERFVIVSGKSDSYTMSGSTEDVRHVEKLKKQIPGDFIWFQRDEKSYIIRDQATIDRARKFWAPQEELGKKQEELGRQQEALGKQQEELGEKMEQVRVNVPDLTAELDKLKAKLQKLGPTATVEQIGDLQSEIGDLQSKIGEIQSQAGEQQGKLGELQGELGEKQGKLGEQQGELGRQQAQLAEQANRQMQELLDQAIKNGTAKPEEEIVKSPTL